MVVNQNNKTFNYIAELIILAGLSLFAVFISLFNQNANSVLLFFQNSIVILLTLAAVWLLFYNENYLASYLILFLAIYSKGLYSFIAFIASFNFSELKFMIGFDWTTVISSLAAAYLMIVIVLYFKKDGFSFNKENFQIDQLLLFFPLFIFLSFGIEMLIYVALIEFIAINYKKMASLALMLSKVIVSPFNFTFKLVNSGFTLITSKDIVLLALAIYVIFLIVKKAIYLFKYQGHTTIK